MKSKYLFTVSDIKLIDKLKDEGINIFVYPLSFFCVGISNTFEISDIKENNSYIFINEIFDTKKADKLNVILHSLPSNIKGIIFDDIGIVEMTKDLNIEKILFSSHFNTNYLSINYYLDYVDSIIVSTDITEEEIDEIILKSKKELTLFSFGLVSSMYSRRHLITNHAEYYKIEKENPKKLEIDGKKFIALENEDGTVLYHYPYYNALRLLNKKAKYYFFFPIFLDNESIIKIINKDLNGIETDYGFLDTKTIYKIKNDN